MKKTYPYIPHSEEDIKDLCREVGVKDISGLLAGYPEELLMKEPLDLPSGLSEQSVSAHMRKLSKANITVDEVPSFLGAGAYNHYIPAVVDHVLLRSEFYTAYTPYQPEISQGTLQAIFEYQTMICQLTGMDVSNASLYDGASATAEAVLMALRLTSRKKAIVASTLHPEYRETVSTYLSGGEGQTELVDFDIESGVTPLEALRDKVDDSTACVVIQSPNFFGAVEDLRKAASIAHEKGALLIAVVSEALSMALLKSPGESGADITVGEAQSFGNHLSFGGPYLGFMAVKDSLMRQMPGRVVGETLDKSGKRAYCLTLATREQHIRREKATSNICTNQGLSALACAVYLSALGRSGLMELAKLNLSKAEYLKKALSSIDGVRVAFTTPTFNEFVINVGGDVGGGDSKAPAKDSEEVLSALLAKGAIVGGLALKRFYPKLTGHILVAATEMNSKEEMDAFQVALRKVLK